MAQASASNPAGKATSQDRAAPSPPAVASVRPSGLKATAGGGGGGGGGKGRGEGGGGGGGGGRE